MSANLPSPSTHPRPRSLLTTSDRPPRSQVDQTSGCWWMKRRFWCGLAACLELDVVAHPTPLYTGVQYVLQAYSLLLARAVGQNIFASFVGTVVSSHSQTRTPCTP
jgi:hypothetical protein